VPVVNSVDAPLAGRANQSGVTNHKDPFTLPRLFGSSRQVLPPGHEVFTSMLNTLCIIVSLTRRPRLTNQSRNSREWTGPAISIAGIGLSFQGPGRRCCRPEGRRKLGVGAPLVKHDFKKILTSSAVRVGAINCHSSVQYLGARKSRVCSSPGLGTALEARSRPESATSAAHRATRPCPARAFHCRAAPGSANHCARGSRTSVISSPPSKRTR
jgi:hypothetical protein